MALRQGLEALSQGSLSSKKEAERRAESRQMAAERRALTAQEDAESRDWQRKQDLFGMESERWVDQQKLLHGFRGEEAEATFARLLKADEIRYGRDEASKLAAERRSRYDKINDLIMASTSEKAILAIKNNVKRAESADDAAENYGKMLAKAVAEGNQEETDRLARELEKAELQRTEAWARIPGVEPLTSRQPSQFKVFSILGNEIAASMNQKIGDKLYTKMLLSIKDGKKDSADYQAAVKTIDNYLEEVYKTNPVLNDYSGTKKRDLRKYLIEKTFYNISQGVTKDDEKITDPATDAGNGVLEPSFWGGNPLDNIATDITKEDIGTAKIAQAAFDARPPQPGRSGEQSQEHKNLIKARNRDPEYLLPHLDEEKRRIEKQLALPIYHPPRIQDRLNKINELIKKFGDMLANQQSAVPSPASNTSFGTSKLSMSEPPGMLNPRGGMIFEADQMNMAPAAVNARYA
jgi:hypothetical protein